MLSLLMLIMAILGYNNINSSKFLSNNQVDGTLTDEAIWLQVTIYYATVGTMPPTALPSRTFSAADHATAWHFQQTAEAFMIRSWLTNDARQTQRYFNTLTALALTATPTPSPSKTATATPTSTPTRTPTPPFGGGGDPLCPGGGGEWMWVDGELVFVCGVTWE